MGKHIQGEEIVAEITSRIGHNNWQSKIISGTAAPNDADGEPDGTIYIQTA